MRPIDINDYLELIKSHETAKKVENRNGRQTEINDPNDGRTD